MMQVSRLLVVLAVLIGMIGLQFAVGRAEKAEKNKIPPPPWEPGDFVDEGGDPFPIDNPYWPLVPGTTFLYEAVGEEEAETIEMYVTYDTRDVAGVTCTVVEEREWEGDLLVEYTEDWYAQDRDGNIWYFGEYSEAYEYDDDGNLIGVSTEGSWEAGVDGAEPGIIMLANPQPGDSYRQEYYEGEAEDMAKVKRLNAFVSVVYGDFGNCLVTKEWNPLERGEIEHKYYAPDVGLVLVNELKGKTKRVELIDITGP